MNPSYADKLAKKLKNRWHRLLTAYYSALNQEIYILSYPKSGRTWLRVLLGKIFQELGYLSEADIVQDQSFPPAWGLPPVYWSHEDSAMVYHLPYGELSPDKSSYRGKKVVILSRDVKDTLVSAYFQATKRIHVFDGSIAEFIRDDRYGAKKILAYYHHWEQNLDIPQQVHLMRYEEMNANLEQELEKLLIFLGLGQVNASLRHQAIEFASFDNLKHLEQKNYFKSEILRPGDRKDPNSFKVRQGKVGDYVNHFSPGDIAYVDEQIAAFGLSRILGNVSAANPNP
jgi:hypothetical protein